MIYIVCRSVVVFSLREVVVPCRQPPHRRCICISNRFFAWRKATAIVTVTNIGQSDRDAFVCLKNSQPLYLLLIHWNIYNFLQKRILSVVTVMLIEMSIHAALGYGWRILMSAEARFQSTVAWTIWCRFQPQTSSANNLLVLVIGIIIVLKR